MRVLAIDTCGPVIGVAVYAHGHTWQREARVTRGAEAHLLPWARELASQAGFILSDLDGVAASVGPGAFTGLRVGLAAACGVALAAGVPVWSGLSLAHRGQAAELDGRVLSLLDARKSRVYAAVIDADGSVCEGPDDVDPEVAVGWMPGPFVATGEGALVYREAVERAGGQVHAGAESTGVSWLARAAAAGLAAGEGTDPAAVRPTYLRAPDAKPPKRR